MKKLTLICGAPLSGKSTLAKQIAHDEGAMMMETDVIRDWMKQIVPKVEGDALFYDVDGPDEFYRVLDTAEKVMNGEIAQSEAIERGIWALLKTHHKWDHLVFEGIAMVPRLMHEIDDEYPDVEVEKIVLVDADRERALSRIKKRGLWGPIGTYPEELIDREIEWVVLYNQWFEDQAREHNIPVRYIED